MKKNKTMKVPKENLAITEQKKYLREIKTIPVEQQTLCRDYKKKKENKPDR